ncbi:MAG TPA: 16S rRNA (guanine(966)-N(2))-methyltransferase RsmD [Terracidiphilus sp.]|nr:16S rRNA (guanine(966)-N(2))-methyltransferase RsmD [Terracidiphilus sp.]
MRVIAGTLRSRTLQAPAGLSTRPTSDRLRETLFNVLTPQIARARFLDLYAGSGAVGIEALSRGATQVTFVERAPTALKILRKNLFQLDLRSGFQIQPGSVDAYLQRARPEVGFDVVFLDPPYEDEREYDGTLGLLGRTECALLATGAVVIAEHSKKRKPRGRYGALRRTRLLEQGDAALSFYCAEPHDEAAG